LDAASMMVLAILQALIARPTDPPTLIVKLVLAELAVLPLLVWMVVVWPFRAGGQGV
jgi:hypothetical protein